MTQAIEKLGAVKGIEALSSAWKHGLQEEQHHGKFEVTSSSRSSPAPWVRFANLLLMHVNKKIHPQVTCSTSR